MKKAVALLLCVGFAMCLIACAGPETVQTLSPNPQLQLTLPDEFVPLGQMSGTEEFLYAGDGVYISGFRESKEKLQAVFPDMDLQMYGEKSVELNKLDTSVTEKDGKWTFTYETDLDGSGYTFCCVILETEDSFWRVQAGCATERYDQEAQTLWEYLVSVKTVS